MFPAIATTALVFLVWDHYFTINEVWGFNKLYITGVHIWKMPIEEWLFFITIPFACVFIYEVLNYFIKRDWLERYSLSISLTLIAVFLVGGIASYPKLYTFFNLLFAAIVLISHLILFKNRIIGRYYLTYLIILIPFFVVNGILTGSFIDEEVVWYDDTHNLGIRLLTIPIEDLVYAFSLILMNVSIYEYLKKRRQTYQ